MDGNHLYRNRSNKRNRCTHTHTYTDLHKPNNHRNEEAQCFQTYGIYLDHKLRATIAASSFLPHIHGQSTLASTLYGMYQA